MMPREILTEAECGYMDSVDKVYGSNIRLLQVLAKS